MQLLVAAIAGFVFSAGLVISGMTDPAKVINFLDFSGTWDPSLAFVMGGAITVAFPAFQWAKRARKSAENSRFQLPTRTDIDRPLVVGSALFGLGWGLSGYCPGPALVSVVLAWKPMLVFFSMLLLGMWAARRQSQSN